MSRKLLIAAVVVIALASQMALALNLGEALIKTVATGAIVTAVAKPADKGINTLLMNNHLPVGTSTKVVPVLSVGEKGYVGMAQVAGTAKQVSQAKSVVQVETAFADKQYRIKLLMPMNSVNPIGVSRVRGLGVSALIDMALSHNSYEVPPSVGWNVGDVIKAGAIAYAASSYGSQINGFINGVYKTEGGLPEGTTKVVPYLSFGTKAYIGMMQVAGPPRAVQQVKAVWQFEQLFDSGRIRLRALVPTDSINPLKLKRVKGVGCTAVIDAMLLREKEERRYPEQYAYFRRAPVFVGVNEDPIYHRPPGWDRGEKVGWAKHGNPYLPPGQAKKQRVPGLVLPDVGSLLGGGDRPRKEEYKLKVDEGKGKLDYHVKIDEGKPDKGLFKMKIKDDKGRGRALGRGHGRGKGRGHEKD